MGLERRVLEGHQKLLVASPARFPDVQLQADPEGEVRPEPPELVPSRK